MPLSDTRVILTGYGGVITAFAELFSDVLGIVSFVGNELALAAVVEPFLQTVVDRWKVVFVA